LNKKDASTRIYFADILFGMGLYEEAYDEYSEIKMLTLTTDQKNYVDGKTEQINKKLIKS
jgi:hypothetical protein